MKVENMSVTYEEVAEGAGKAGKVEMKNINADVRNFSCGARSKDTLIVNATAKMMDGKAKVKWKFPLSADKVLFYSEGVIENLPLTSLNSMTKTNAGIEIISGRLDRLTYSMKADHNYARGEVHMQYRDLKISVENDNIGKAAATMATFAVNQFLIHDHNSSSDGEERVGTIAYPNNPQRFIFNYSWKALLSGITDIVQVKKKQR